MRAVLWVLVLISSTSFAGARARLVLHPVAPFSGQTASVPPAAAAALLADAATRPVQLPSTFEVDDALASLAQPACAESDACLGALAKVTRSGWALGVTARVVNGAWELTGRVVNDAGVMVRPPQSVTATPAAVGFDWAGAAKTLLNALKLNELRLDDELQPLTLAVKPDAPRQDPAPPPPPSVTPLDTTPVLSTAAKPTAGGWRRPTAAVVGGLALAAGGAAVTLALVNAREAELLRGHAQGGLIPVSQLERAASLDERTMAATGLGIGAAVAAGAALTLWLSAPTTTQVGVAVTPTGGAVTLTGALP